MSKTPDTPVAMEDRKVEDGRLYSPSAARNRAAIAEVFGRVLPARARVLEIGSGTGEHAVAVCQARPDIRWQPSDPDPVSRASQAGWARESGAAISAPLALDLLTGEAVSDLAPFDVLVCMNVIHIAPWAVAENLARLAAERLQPGGRVVLYGPYKEGDATAPSNLDFDASLKSRNPAWGVRDLDSVITLFAEAGFALAERVDMPANNLLLVLSTPETR